jgi:hypothetical protein
MPMEMTTTWILAGIVMIFAMLLVATILPRPSREYSLSQLPFTVTSAARRASRFAMGKNGTKDDSSKESAATDAKEGQSTDRQGGQRGGKGDGSKDQADSKSGKGTEDKKGSGQDKGSGESSKSQSSGDGKGAKGEKSSSSDSKANGQSPQRNAESSAAKKADDQSQKPDSQNTKPPPADQPQNQPANSGSSSAGQIMSKIGSLLGQTVVWLLKLAFYAALLIAGLVAAWFYREELQAAWRKLLAELRELWDSWFGQKKAAEQAAAPLDAPVPPRPFAAFSNPFTSGEAARMPWPQLVRYTFEALEAWGHEQGCPRAPGQTPHEFALALAAIEPQLASHVQKLSAWYGQLAYAPHATVSGSPEPLRELWQLLNSRRVHEQSEMHLV